MHRWWPMKSFRRKLEQPPRDMHHSRRSRRRGGIMTTYCIQRSREIRTCARQWKPFSFSSALSRRRNSVLWVCVCVCIFCRFCHHIFTSRITSCRFFFVAFSNAVFFSQHVFSHRFSFFFWCLLVFDRIPHKHLNWLCTQPKPSWLATWNHRIWEVMHTAMDRRIMDTRMHTDHCQRECQWHR